MPQGHWARGADPVYHATPRIRRDGTLDLYA